MGSPIYVDDVTKDEAMTFLTQINLIGLPTGSASAAIVNHETAKQIYDLVGGRMFQLALFKRDAYAGIPFKTTRNNLLSKDRVKMIGVRKTDPTWELIDILWNTPTRSCRLSVMMKTLSQDVIDECIDRGIIRLVRGPDGIKVKFESKLTEETIRCILKREEESETAATTI